MSPARERVGVQGEHQRGEHVQPVDCARRRQPAPQPPPRCAHVAPGQLGPAQPQRLHEQDPVLKREPLHQVVLVSLQVGVPVGEPNADDVAALKPRRIGHPDMISGAQRGEDMDGARSARLLLVPSL